MRASWEALKESLERSVDPSRSKSRFDELQRHDHLSRFQCATALVTYLNDPTGDRDEKDAIYASLIEVAQSRDRPRAEQARTLLWLGLWPGLDAIHRRRRRDFPGEPEALVSELSTRFLEAVHRMDLTRVNRVAATLVRNVSRDLCDGLKRRWDEDKRRADMPDIEVATEDTTGIIRLEPDEDVRALRGRLADVVGDDADLVIGCLIYDESQRSMAERLGVSHEAARKRLQRAKRKVQQRYRRTS
ncbi:MAG: sigma-70 family RNA polymerase sigma factor [Deltaproteobacteria bacterium]|nr:MAG: sigma-70 family RNA polymerase sigma factor [Deltaproteobacteria bacterium]